MFRRRWVRWGVVVGLVLVMGSAVFHSRKGARLTETNYRQIQLAMTESEVTALLGDPRVGDIHSAGPVGFFDWQGEGTLAWAELAKSFTASQHDFSHRKMMWFEGSTVIEVDFARTGGVSGKAVARVEAMFPRPRLFDRLRAWLAL